MFFSVRSVLRKKHTPDEGGGTRHAASRLRSMPSWLALSPWFVVAGSLLLSLLMLMMDYRSGARETAVTTRIYLEQSTTLIHAFKAALQAGLTFQWSDETTQAVLNRIGSSSDMASDIYYMAVTDEQGQVLMASDPAMVGKAILPADEMAKLHPALHPSSHEFHTPDKKPVFQVYQLLSFRQYEERLRRHGHHGQGGCINPWIITPIPETKAQEQRLLVFIGYDMTPLKAAQNADARRTLMHWIILAAIGAVGVLTLFLVKGYQRSRQLVQETSAFTFALLDALPLGLIAVDSARRITTVNPEAERITGCKSGDLLGRELNSSLPGLWAVIQENSLPEAGAEPYEEEVRCLLNDGRRVPLALTVTPVAAPASEEGGSPRCLGYAFMLRDLGEIRRLQAEIRRQDRLAALGHMAAGIAHEIRNPLGSIKGLARVFQELAPEASQEARMAGIMTQEVQRLDNVVGNLLELARPDRLNRTEVSPVQLLDRARMLMQADMEKAGIVYRQEAPSPCPSVLLDGDRMTQVILNLFLNAIQAMPEGGELCARVSFPARQEAGTPEAGHDDVLLLEISDTGSGIPKDKLAQIFSPYYTTKARGTGLGLSLVYKIIEAHDGDIEVSSSEGKGTCFSMRLPLPAAAQKENQ